MEFALPKVRKITIVLNIDLFWHSGIYKRESDLISKVTSKEYHSLTRTLVGYRNRRQWWCKKEGNNVLGKDKSYI